MSIEDDDYDLDDDVLDGMFDEDDFEDDLDDFDEIKDEGMSFDEDEVLFEEDDNDGMGGADDALIGTEKKKFAIDIGFDKIAIIGAVIVGVIVLVFQVTTKTAEQKVETFQSALTMKGATDGEVFGQSQSKDITPTAPESQGEQQAFLYEPDALNVLPNNLKDGAIVKDLEIAPVQNPAPSKKVSQFVSTLPESSNEEPVGEFVSASGDVLKSQMDFIPEDSAAAKDNASSDFEKDLMELEGDNTPEETKIITQSQEDLTFVPIAQVIEPQDKADAQKIDEQQAVALQKQRQEAQAIENEMAQLRHEVEKLKREKARLAEQARIEKEALVKMEASKKRLAAEKERMEQAQAVSAAAAKARAQQAALKKKQKEAAQQKASISKEVAPPKVKEKRVVWELRAAQPGKAWISEKGKQDITAVTVGSSVRGLGKVRSILIQDGRWVVIGSDGRVQQ